MATLKPFFGPDTSGGKNRVMIQVLIWSTVGNAKFEKFEDFEASVTGKIDTVFYKGDISGSIVLTDRDPKAQSGPCVFTINGTVIDGTYNVSGKMLKINFEYDKKKHEVTCEAGGGGTYISGLPVKVWVGP